MSIKILIISILLLISLPVFSQGETLVVVVHVDNKCTCSLDLVRKIYLGRVRNFRDGTSAVAVTYKDESALRAKFYDLVLHSNKNRLGKLWARLVFSGRNTAPVVLESTKDVLVKIAANKNYIGFISVQDVTTDVKVVGTL